MEDEHINYVFKVIILGDSAVGKSSLLRKYIFNDFNENQPATIGCEYVAKTHNVDSKAIKAQLWDSAGQERYCLLPRLVYRNAVGAVIVYDITSHKSFRNVIKWYEEVRKYSGNPDIVILLVGNKYDLRYKREVSTEEARAFAEENKFYWIETSALDRTNVDMAFSMLFNNTYSIRKSKNLLEENSEPEKTGIIKPSNKETPVEDKKRKCCFWF